MFLDLYEWYDHLRLRHPVAGALAAKLRAEMVMYGSFVFVVLLSLSVHVWTYRTASNLYVVAGFAVTAFLVGGRWRDHAPTWEFAVANFYAQAHFATEPHEKPV